MKKIYTIIFITILSVIAYTQAEKIKLAVSPFDDNITAAGEGTGKDTTSLVENQFSSIDRFYVRKADQIRSYINDISLVQSGMKNPDSLKKNSSTLKVDYLTVGSIAKFGNTYEIDARTVNVNNWIIVYSQGSSSSSIGSAVNNIGWYIKEKFTFKLLKEKQDESVEKPVVSVLKFTDDNFKARQSGYSGAFAETLNSELGSFDLISTVERTYAKALIEEKAFEMSGVIENDNSDDSFQRKGIEYKVTGNFKEFKDVICINYQMYKTSNKKIVFMGAKEIASISAMRSVAKELAATIEDVLNNRLGTLKLTTKPAKAKIFIDGEPAGKSPVLISLTKGKHEIKIQETNYETFTGEIDIKAKTVQSKNIKLAPLSMKLMKQALSYESKGDWENAVLAYGNFIEKYHDTSFANTAMYRKGHVEMINLKQYDKALKTFNELVSRYPDTLTRAEAYFGLVKVYNSKGDKTKARETLNYLLTRYGDSFPAEEARTINWKF